MSTITKNHLRAAHDSRAVTVFDPTGEQANELFFGWVITSKAVRDDWSILDTLAREYHADHAFQRAFSFNKTWLPVNWFQTRKRARQVLKKVGNPYFHVYMVSYVILEGEVYIYSMNRKK